MGTLIVTQLFFSLYLNRDDVTINMLARQSLLPEQIEALYSNALYFNEPFANAH